MGLNWQSRCAVFLFENNRVSVDDATETWQGDDLHRKGATPRRNRPRCVCSCGAMEVGPWRESQRASPRLRRIIESLVKPPCTLFLFSPSSSLLFLHFVCSFSIGPYIPFSILDTIYELSRQPFLVFFIFYHYHIRFFSILLSLPHSIWFLIKYICLTRTHAREHAHLIITRPDRIIPVRPQPILTTLYDCFRNSFIIFYEPINCYHALLNLLRIHYFVLFCEII